MSDESMVLFLKGIYKKDLIAPSYENYNPEEEESAYDEIPHRFYSLDQWILQTNVLCSHCGLPHNNIPIFIPDYFNGQNNGITIMRALFCTFPCAMSYIKKNYPGSKFDNLLIAIKYVYELFTNEKIDEIPTAPDPLEIDAFGGKNARYKMSQYQKYVNNLIPMNKYLIQP